MLASSKGQDKKYVAGTEKIAECVVSLLRGSVAPDEKEIECRYLLDIRVNVKIGNRLVIQFA